MPRRYRITYDQLSYDLAGAFLSDAGFTDPKLIHQLAQEVQQTVEDFITYFERVQETHQAQAQSEPSQSTSSQS